SNRMNSDEPTPTTMDEEFLMETALKQHFPKQGWCLPKLKEIHSSEILKLRLDYKNIQNIDNLWDFTSLERLDLNSNCIEKIQGLDLLINLTWINLSFNRIEKIEGLATLQKLELLDLSNNKISVIENVDTLENITHFFIANNLIEELDNVLQLKKFKKLFTLNLSGNPFTKEDDYKVFIAAHMPNLKYLNCRLLDSAVVSVHTNPSCCSHRRLECQEAELQLHKDAFVESLNGSYLFNSLFQDDPEAETLRLIPDVANQMVELCVQLFEMGLTELERRQTEVNSFFSDQDMVAADYQQKATQMLEKFDEQHKEVYGVSWFHYTTSQNFGYTVSFNFRNMEDSYHQKVKEIAVETLEKVAKGNLDEDLPDAVALFTEKYAVMDALATGHDNHLLKISDRETRLVGGLSGWKVTLIKGIQDKELKQNRTRISDIQRYVGHLKEQLEDLLQNQ
uniref:Dynein regulatory complex subunit 3 n=1 Tax=Acanthochromis polyacanthus TaxID=80966 RepID=A0A3Q1HZ45_9TELE